LPETSKLLFLPSNRATTFCDGSVNLKFKGAIFTGIVTPDISGKVRGVIPSSVKSPGICEQELNMINPENKIIFLILLILLLIS
jgi:hypothetical protein